MARASQLVNVMHERRLVRFSRRFEVSSICGYVLDVGPQFFLLALVSDRIWFDGFECFRVSDVSNLRTDPLCRIRRGGFEEAGRAEAKETKGQSDEPRKSPAVGRSCIPACSDSLRAG